MCDYTQVEYVCGHLRFLVRAWCVRYQETHKRCPPNIVAIEHRLEERCSDCKDPPTPKYHIKPRNTSVASNDNESDVERSRASDPSSRQS